MVNHVVFFISFVVIYIAIILLNGIWFSTMRGFYKYHLSMPGDVTNAGLSVYSMLIICWALLAFGFVYLVPVPGLCYTGFSGLLRGAAYGFCFYSAYHVMNYVLVPRWSIVLMLIDICWGTVLYSFLGLCSDGIELILGGWGA